MRISTIVNAHMTRERLDVWLSVILPFVFMVESGYANGWCFAGGTIDLSLNTAIAMFRGLFLEVGIFTMFKIVRILFVTGKWQQRVVSILPLLIGIVAMVVSAGLNIGWANRSGEMQNLISTVSEFLPLVFLEVFKLGIGLLFPVAVGILALLDVGHLVTGAMELAREMNERSMVVGIAESNHQALEKEMRRSAKQAKSRYKEIADVHIDKMVEAARRGDYSFNMDTVTRPSTSSQSSVTRVTPTQSPLLPSAPVFPQLNGPAITGQFTAPPTLSSGNTQNIQFPPIQPYPQMSPLPQKP